MKKKVIKVDRDKCIGCGACVIDCHQGVLEIIDGKAVVVRESECDGIGNCIGSCPQDALHIEEVEFEEKEEKLPCGCPGTMIQDFKNDKPEKNKKNSNIDIESELQQWPVQLKLLSSNAPFFKDADIVVSADCVSYSFADFHRKFLKNKILIVFCPKLDNAEEIYKEKLTEILKNNNIKSITVVKMEVPCCMGTLKLVQGAILNSGKDLNVKEVTVSLRGEIL